MALFSLSFMGSLACTAPATSVCCQQDLELYSSHFIFGYNTSPFNYTPVSCAFQYNFTNPSFQKVSLSVIRDKSGGLCCLPGGFGATQIKSA